MDGGSIPPSSTRLSSRLAWSEDYALTIDAEEGAKRARNDTRTRHAHDTRTTRLGAIRWPASARLRAALREVQIRAERGNSPPLGLGSGHHRCELSPLSVRGVGRRVAVQRKPAKRRRHCLERRDRSFGASGDAHTAQEPPRPRVQGGSVDGDEVGARAIVLRDEPSAQSSDAGH